MITWVGRAGKQTRVRIWFGGHATGTIVLSRVAIRDDVLATNVKDVTRDLVWEVGAGQASVTSFNVDAVPSSTGSDDVPIFVEVVQDGAVLPAKDRERAVLNQQGAQHHAMTLEPDAAVGTLAERYFDLVLV